MTKKNLLINTFSKETISKKPKRLFIDNMFVTYMKFNKNDCVDYYFV